MKSSVKKKARLATLVTALGLAIAPAMQAQADIFWPGGNKADDKEKSKQYKKGFKDGQEDCRQAPRPCGVLIEDVVADAGYGETEPNDHIVNADGMVLGQFYHANSFDIYDEDWFSVVTDKPNMNLTLNFLGDPADYANTAGWIIEVRDIHGNIIAAFNSEADGNQGATPTPLDPTEEPAVPNSPLSNAKVTLVTLGNAGTYYISVTPFLKESVGKNPPADGTWRAYSIAALLSDSGQTSPNPDTNFFDTETEPNDEQNLADPLRSNVHMFAVFDKTPVRQFIPPKPPEFEIKYFYKQCDPLDPSTIPAGLATCECDLTADPFPINPNMAPPDNAAPGKACEAKEVLKPGTGDDSGKWIAAFNYEEDWFTYSSPGGEALSFQICAKGDCGFTIAHLRISHAGNVTIYDGPVTPGFVYNMGAGLPGSYYFQFTPEATGKIDAETGVFEVHDLSGPYNFLLRATGLKPGG